ncbi:hypothetical protein Ptr86124_013377 [Pyrenophora tritici-repentis]|uniref:Uncharacterized protein n=1 Tax=Pyrenophora tritici-repentis TaxID=45151 RepID=A0A922N3Z6_9PLEO|nr:hypothetical protein Ptr86124_013377 [Pyrenophora tritici-repentis]
MAEVVIETLQDFGINANNDCTVKVLAHKYGFNAAHRRLRCGPHTLNLVGQTLLWGKDGDAFNNDARELHDERDFMEEWRRVGPLGVLLSVISYIKTPQQHKLFKDFQRLAYKELPANALAKERKAVITEYIDVLKPLKTATERLEGRSKSGGFGSIAEVIPVFKYLLSYYKQRVNSYAAVDYNAHPKAPEDHLATNLRAA